MGFLTLRDYLERTGETQEALAERLSVTPMAVSHWVNGKSKPSLQMALKIEAITGVPCRAWASQAELKRDRRTGADRRLGGRRRENRVAQPDRRKGPRR